MRKSEPEKPLIKLSVEMTDGTFQSYVTVAPDATDAVKRKAVDDWLKMIRFGLQLDGDVNITVSK